MTIPSALASIATKTPGPRARRWTVALVLLLQATATMGLVPAGAAESTFTCPSSYGTLPARVGHAGAIPPLRTEDSSIFNVPVVPGQRSVAYIRVHGQILDAGSASLTYTFYNVSAWQARVQPLACDVAPLATDTHTFAAGGQPFTAIIERPVFFAQQNLVVDLHIQATGFSGLVWDVEVYACGNGGWLC